MQAAFRSGILVNRPFRLLLQRSCQNVPKNGRIPDVAKEFIEVHGKFSDVHDKLSSAILQLSANHTQLSANHTKTTLTLAAMMFGAFLTGLGGVTASYVFLDKRMDGLKKDMDVFLLKKLLKKVSTLNEIEEVTSFIYSKEKKNHHHLKCIAIAQCLTVF